MVCTTRTPGVCIQFFNEQYIGLNDDEKETLKLKHKYEDDAIQEHWSIIGTSDVVLILNYDKHSVANYIDGTSFLEMGFAYIQKKPLYLHNPIPDMPYYKTEIIAMNPKVIDGDLEKIFQ